MSLHKTLKSMFIVDWLRSENWMNLIYLPMLLHGNIQKQFEHIPRIFLIKYLLRAMNVKEMALHKSKFHHFYMCIFCILLVTVRNILVSIMFLWSVLLLFIVNEKNMLPQSEDFQFFVGY